MGRNSVRQAQRKQSRILSKHYYKGLNFLLSDQPDKAVDTLIKMINLDSQTVETHIAMGNFFRHRGELDRAIKVHQNLVSQEEISDEQKQLALLELGKDYIQAGFLERAENSFLQLLKTDKHYLQAQDNLFNIYQTTKEWERAIELAESMMANQGDSDELCQRISHFYCEQATILLKKQDYQMAEKLLQKAIMADEHAIRPWLIMGQTAMQQASYTQAIDYLQQIPRRDITWLSEAVPLLAECAEKTNSTPAFEEYLEQYWQQCATAYLAKVKIMSERGELQNAADVLLEKLRTSPTMKGFKELMKLYIEQNTDQPAMHSLEMLKSLVEEQINQRPKYRCSSCGFSGRQIYWLCPSCKKWGVVKPIKGLDGE